MDAAHERMPAKVLFVDDEENILRAIKRLLADEEYGVVTATSGEEALVVLKNEGSVGVIVSDQRMPGMSGVDFLEKAKTITPDAQRILLTGYADISATIDAINRGGAQRYLAKPWNDHELTLVVRDAVHKYQVIKENEYLRALTEKQAAELQKWSTELELDVQQQTIDITKQNEELRRLHEELSRNVKNIISALSSLIELRDVSVLNHSNNVALIATAMARRLGLGEGTIQDIGMAGQLHDLGKIHIPDIVLLKRVDEMNSDELDVYRSHPVCGQVALSFMEELRDVGLAIRHHHEWYDGSGFPDRLKGEAIPLAARVVALADGFDHAMARFDPIESLEAPLREMAALGGTQYDPHLVPFLKHAVREKADVLTTRPDGVEVELGLKDVVPGLVVSRDVRSGTGLLLLGRGATLDEASIWIMKRCLLLDPAKSGIFVWRR
jgi:response regulator RpfG family c-di-GMP phosphodiesterase